MQWYANTYVQYTEMICICIKCYPNSSRAVVQLAFDPQNYTVTEGSSVNITLEAVPPSEGYDFSFTVTLLYMNGSATGEFAYTALTVKDWSSSTLTLCHQWSFVSLSLSTAGSDYTPGPYTVTFTAGQMLATLTLPTMDDSTTELSEYLVVVITSTDQPDAVEIISPNTAFITTLDNDPGTAQHAHSAHDSVHVSNVLCMYVQYCVYAITHSMYSCLYNKKACNCMAE